VLKRKAPEALYDSKEALKKCALGTIFGVFSIISTRAFGAFYLFIYNF
jgi:hypothetical protein